MIQPRKYLHVVLGFAALCVAASSYALTLGRANGAVNLGQPLKLAVPVQMEAGEGTSALCFEADVFYGDIRQDASRIAVRADWYPQSQSATVVVSSSSAVDEPVVTVYLRAGCQSKTTRRYVMLSEAAPIVLAASTPTSLLPVLPRAATSRASRTPERDSESLLASAKREKAVRIAKEPEALPVKPSASKKPREPARRAYLTLTPLDLTQELDPVLKLSNQLVLEGSEDLQNRARAAALWNSLNTTPEELLNSESLRRTMELDFRNLQGITAKNRQLLQDMSSRLDKAEAGRYSNPLVYGLFLAIAAICLAIAYFWNKARKGGLVNGHWWQDDMLGDKSETVEFADGDASTARTAGKGLDLRAGIPQSVPPKDVPAKPLSKFAYADIDLNIDNFADLGGPTLPAHIAVPEPVRTKPRTALPISSGHADFGHSMSATLLRSVNTKEMLDVRQQAEFFMTLGQHEEAIALLRGSVDDGADANPLVYLELLKVLHTLGLKTEYDHYRQGFNAIFNGRVPTYTDFSHAGSGLEAYTAVCQKLIPLWPSAAAVSYIENCLVRTRQQGAGQDFDLEAFRDLLMLHGVANRIASVSFDSGFAAFSAAKTAPVPVTAVLGVDVDLDLSQTHDGNLIDFDASDWPPSLPDNVNDKPG